MIVQQLRTHTADPAAHLLFVSLLGLGRLRRGCRPVAMVEEQEREDQQTDDHRERRQVVGRRRIDEALVLCVLQRAHWDLHA